MVNDYDKFAKMRQEQLQKGQKRPHRFLEKPMMRELLPDLSGKKILMLGCGTGEETLILTQYGGRDMIGVDNSAESIRLAKETYPEFEFIVADMHSLPFEDETFDFVHESEIKFDEALKYGEKALEIKKSILDENSTELSISLAIEFPEL